MKLPRRPAAPARRARGPFARALGVAGSVALAGCTVITVPAEPVAPARAPQPSEGPASTDAAARSAPSGTDAALPVTLDPLRPFEEVRALWVVRFTLTTEDAVREMVDRAHAAGFNTLIVQVRGRADAFYDSTLEPRGESVREEDGFDPLALVIREAHARGIAVHAWVNTHLVWGPTEPPVSPDHLVNAHPDWLAVPKDLGRELVAVDPFDASYLDRLVEHAAANDHVVEGIYTSPSHPAVHDRVHAIWLDIARRYDLDGLHFDYIRFPSADYDYSLGALERFRQWIRLEVDPDRFSTLDAAYAGDLYAFVESEPELWDTFRRRQVSALVERIYRDVKAHDPRLVVSAAVIADRDVAYDDRFQDWPTWLREGVLDVAVPMAYTPDATRFVDLIETARNAAGDRRRVWAGIGAYMNTPEGTLAMIDIARGEDAGGVVLFSYDWVVGEGESDPSDPLLERIGRAKFGR